MSITTIVECDDWKLGIRNKVQQIDKLFALVTIIDHYTDWSIVVLTPPHRVCGNFTAYIFCGAYSSAVISFTNELSYRRHHPGHNCRLGMMSKSSNVLFSRRDHRYKLHDGGWVNGHLISRRRRWGQEGPATAVPGNWNVKLINVHDKQTIRS